MTTPDTSQARRALLAKIATREAEGKPKGDRRQSGPAIERYLALFRETMNRRAGTSDYSDTSVGYAWCAAFAYFCCLEAGFRLSPEPSGHVNGSLAAVSTWYEWASLPGSAVLVERERGPEVGDIVVFDHLLEDKPLDHLGVVVGARPGFLVTAEGNVGNRAGIFRRRIDDRVKCFIRLRD
jgi:hypothetical protein